MGGALDGLRVIDFGQYLAGPLLAQLLGDHGAEVIRIDPPGGPRWPGDANAILQRGKQSLVLELSDDEDLATARKLVGTADIVVENFRPGAMDRLGLGAERCIADNPRLIYCSLPGFASSDPRAGMPAYEGVVAAAAGLYPVRDFDPAGEPVVNTLPLSSVFAAVIGANSVVAALLARERSGRGQRVEVSLFDASYELVRFYGDRTTPEPRYPSYFMLGGSRIPPLAGHFRCGDGRWVQLSWHEGRQFEDFAKLVGREDEWRAEGLLGVPFERFWSDLELSRKAQAVLEPIFLERTAAEWERSVNPECDLTEVRTSQEWLLYDQQARILDTAITLIDPELGVTHQIGHAITMSGTPPRVRAPRQSLDAARDEVLGGLPGRDRLPPDAPAVRAVGGALEGVTVIDMCQLLAGPTVGRILAEYGAEVIHISHPAARASLEYRRATDSGKKTISLDLRKPGGLDVFWRIIERADVVSTNFSDSVASRLGVDESTVRSHRPDIVYSRLSAHGPRGPRADWRGHEQVGQTVTGMQDRYGQDHEHPVMQPFAINDIGSGHLTALGVLLGLFHRARTGEGQGVGSSLSQVAALYQTPYMISHIERVWDDPGGLGCRGTSPTEHLYRASDGWFYLGAPNTDQTRKTLATVEGLGGVDVHSSDLHGQLAAAFATAPREQWVVRLVGAGLGAHEWRTIPEAMADEWGRRHGLIVDLKFPEGDHGRVVGPVARLSDTPMRMGRPANPIGADSEEVIREFGLGDRLDELIAQGTVRLARHD